MTKSFFALLLCIVIGINFFVIFKTLPLKSLMAKCTRACNAMAILGMGVYVVYLLAPNVTVACISYSFFTGLISAMLLTFFSFVYIFTHDRRMPKYISIPIHLFMLLDMTNNFINPIWNHCYEVKKTVINYVDTYSVTNSSFWYVAHFALSYIVVALIMVVLVAKIIKCASVYKRKYVSIATIFMTVILLDAATLAVKLNINISIIFYGILAIAISIYALFIASRDVINDMLGLVVEDLNSGILFFDNNHKCLYSNQRVWDMFCYDKPNFERAEEIYTGTLKKHPFEENRKIVWNDSVEINGEKMYLTVEAQQLFDSKNNYLGCYISIIDETENVKNFEREISMVQESSRNKNNFLSQISHEIRTPLNAIYGMNEMIQQECSDPGILQYSNDIKSSAEMMIDLINDFLDLSKLEAGKMSIKESKYDFKSMLTNIISITYIKSNDKNIDFYIDIDSKIPSVLMGDTLRIQQILINILSNAVKYTEKGSITLSIKCDIIDDIANLHFTITDTGIGIKDEDKAHLFEAYKRFDYEHTGKIQGTGLGLNITIQLLSLMDSALNVESTYGKGSTFSFSILQEIINYAPIGDFTYHKPDAKIFSNINSTMPAGNFYGKKALIVDDTEVNRRVLSSLLKNIGIAVTGVTSGFECLDLITKDHFDIIFLDHHMPGMDGVETLNRINEMDNNESYNAKIVMLTANTGSDAKEYYISLGFDDYLDKPILPDKLKEILNRYLL